MITSVAGDTLFCNGASSTPVSVSPGNLGAGQCSEGSAECAAQQATAQALLGFSSGITLVQADNAITTNAYAYCENSRQRRPVHHSAPDRLPGQQRARLPAQTDRADHPGPRRTRRQSPDLLRRHRQLRHPRRPARLTRPLCSPRSAPPSPPSIRQHKNSASKTTSPHSLCPTSAAPSNPTPTPVSDHAWGSHHIVIGGAVKGGKMYGTFPTLALGGPDDSGSNGRWVPTTGSVQYAATLAQWFGVTSAQLPTIFPNIASFPTASLGFV